MNRIPINIAGRDIIRNTIGFVRVLKKKIEKIASAMKNSPPINSHFHAIINTVIRTKEGIRCMNNAKSTSGN